jgi:hypothetical protein
MVRDRRPTNDQQAEPPVVPDEKPESLVEHVVLNVVVDKAEKSVFSSFAMSVDGVPQVGRSPVHASLRPSGAATRAALPAMGVREPITCAHPADAELALPAAIFKNGR